MSGPANAATAEERLSAAHEAMMRAHGLQHDFPVMAAPPPPPAWLEPLLKTLVQLAPVMKVVFWAGVIVGGALLIWVLVRDLPFASALRRKPPSKANADWRPDAETARALLEEADRLAQAARFDEAIHLILFRSIEDIARRRPGAIRAALTSRDIVEAAPLSDGGRRAFRVIAEAVEHSFFGGRPAGRAAFDRCRSEYAAFAFAEGF